MLSNGATSCTSLSQSLLLPDHVLSILSTGTCHLSSNSLMSAVETSNLFPGLYLRKKNSNNHKVSPAPRHHSTGVFMLCVASFITLSI
jgi:hypothetical protein